MKSRIGFLGHDERFGRLLTAVLATSDYAVVMFNNPAHMVASIKSSTTPLAALIIDTTEMSFVPTEVFSLRGSVPTIMLAQDTKNTSDHDTLTADQPITLGRPLSIPRLLRILHELVRGSTKTKSTNAHEVLVVDDDESYRIFVGEILHTRGFKVLTAENGLEALTILDDHPQVNMFVVDLEMPLMDGPTLIGHVCQRVDSPSILIMTGTQDIELRRWSMNNGYACALVEKPFTSRTFLRFFGETPKTT